MQNTTYIDKVFIVKYTYKLLSGHENFKLIFKYNIFTTTQTLLISKYMKRQNQSLKFLQILKNELV